MKKNSSIKVTLAVLGVSLSLAGCVPGGGGGGSSSSGGSAAAPVAATSTSTLSPASTAALVAQQASNVGVANFDQMNQTFSVLTGVSAQNSSVMTDYTNLQASLPQSNNVASYSGATNTAVATLAASYCNQAITKNVASVRVPSMTTRQTVLPANLMVNGSVVAPANLTSQTPSNLFTAANEAAIAAYMIQTFWNRDPAAPANADDAVLVQLMSDLVAGEANTSTVTQNTLIAVCAATLGNANVFIR
jgi:hypothetical protein